MNHNLIPGKLYTYKDIVSNTPTFFKLVNFKNDIYCRPIIEKKYDSWAHFFNDADKYNTLKNKRKNILLYLGGKFIQPGTKDLTFYPFLKDEEVVYIRSNNIIDLTELSP